MLEKIRRTIERYAMLRSGDRVLVAVSGGPDSVALLHALYELREELGIELIVAHLDHRMRPGSHRDAQFVAELAASLKLPLISREMDVPGLIKAEKRSPEEGARIARYRFLAEAAGERQANVVALGHTMSDRVETFFLNLLRGAGLEGLAGMPPVRHECDTRYVRPLVACSRDEILSFLRERRLRYREDPTNRDLRYARNRVRWELLPLLQELSPGALESISRASEAARLAHEHFQRHVEEAWPDLAVQETDDEIVLKREELLTLDGIVQTYAVREAIRRVRGDLSGIEAAHLEAALDGIRKPRSGTEATLPGGLRLIVEGDRFLITRKEKGARAPYCFELSLGACELPKIGWRFELEVLEGDRPPPPEDPLEAHFDFDTIARPLCVRNRRPGDRFRPVGLGGTKKLQDYFVDEKIPREKREEIPLVCDKQGILWVVGRRLDERARPAAATRRTLRIRAIPPGRNRT